MGYARHIGRVGALAVTLGVGVAVASTPGIAYADPSAGASTSSGDSSSASSSSTTKPSADTDAASAEGSAGTHSSASGPKPASHPADQSTSADVKPTDADVADDVADVKPTDADVADVDVAEADAADDLAEADAADDLADDEDTPPGASDEDAPPADTTQAQDDRSPKTPANGDSAHHQVLSRSGSVHRSPRPDKTDVESTVTAGTTESQPQTLSVAPVAEPPAPQPVARLSTQTRTMSATTLTAAAPAPSVPQQPKTALNLVSDFVTAVLRPLLSPARGTPIQLPILTAALSLVRNEFERYFAPRKVNAAFQQNVTLLTDPSAQPSPAADPSTQHVLVIGVDGTNLSRILADPENENFFS